MKTLFTSIFMLLAVSTFAQKKVVTPKKVKKTVSQPVSVPSPAVIKDAIGVVVVKSNAGKDCPLYIEMALEEGGVVNYAVTDLPAKFQVDGTKIKFDYSMIEVSACTFKSISVSNVRLQKTVLENHSHN